MKIFKYLLVTITTWCFSITGSLGQEYDVKLIPDSLLYNSKAVIRMEKNIIEIERNDKAKEEITYAITILNKNGIKNAEFIKYYNSFTKITNIKAIIYDKNGKKVKKIPFDKIYDYSAISGFSLYEDNRVKYIDPNFRSYPFTIEYTYTVNYNGLLNYPVWEPYEDFNISVMNSEIDVITDNKTKLRYYSKNLDIKPSIASKKDKLIYSWKLTNLKSLEKESYCPDFLEYTPVLFLAPSNFSIDNYDGSMETWQEFGKWINDLNYGRNKLPDETKTYIKTLVKDCKNLYDSVATVYKYMQKKTRYVSVQEGIGGWQPFKAETVDKLGYGDCKSLANYTKSLLDVAGIKSNYILIKAGENTANINSKFPSNQFNHAIVCVPSKKDTIWLECTNPNIPAGYLGTFTDDRDALLITSDGGKIVHTPALTSKENKRIRKTEVSLNSDGNGTAAIHTKYTGLFFDNIFYITQMDDKDKKELIRKNISFANFDITNFKYEFEKSRLPVIHETLDLKIRECAAKMGNLLMVDVTTINKINRIPEHLDERKSNIYIKRPTTEIDSIIINYPENYISETIPKNITINSNFGDYTLDFFPDNDKILCVRTLKINKGNYSPNRYNDFVEFNKKLYKADNAKLVLKQK